MDKIEILFEVNDTENMILGNDLYIPQPFIGELGFKGDWTHESMLYAIEIAYDKGIKVPYVHDCKNDYSFQANFNCKINGILYNVYDTNEKMIISKII